MRQRFINQDINSDERGFVLVVALIVLIVATVVGIFAVQNTVIDTKISGNERIATVMFNAADAGADAGVAWFKANTSEGGKKLTTGSQISAPVGAYFGSNINLDSKTKYNFKIDPLAKSSLPPAGWDPNNYRRYYYLITNKGYTTDAAGNREVQMEVSRVFRK